MAVKKKTQLSSDCQRILNELTNLSLEELSAVSRRSDGLRRALGGSPLTPAAAPVQEYDWLIGGVYRALDAAGLKNSIPPVNKLASFPQHEHYQSHRPGVIAFIEKAIPGMREPERMHIGTLIGGAYLDFLKKHYRHHGVSAMLSRIHEVPQAIEEAWPGYAEAKLLPALLNSRRRESLGGEQDERDSERRHQRQPG